MAATRMDPATVALDRFGHSVEYTYKVLSEICGVPASTVGHRNRGRMSIQQRATNQQYLSPQEEKALITYLLRMARNGFPLLVKFARTLACLGFPDSRDRS